MDTILRGLPLFVEVARQRSFSRASETLDIPLPSVSRRIASLEKELGVRLLNRTTRSVSLTESGKAFFEGADYILSELDILRERVARSEKEASGRLRVSVPEDIYFRYMQGVFGDFVRLYPGIELQVLFTVRWVDLHKDPFDLEIRVGPLPDSELKVRRLGTVHAGIYASAEFMQYREWPESPQELSKIPCIWLYQIEHFRLELESPDGVDTVLVRPVHLVSNISLALELMLAGQGATMMEERLVQEHVRSGRAVRLLPDWHTVPMDISAVMATGRLPQRIRLFIDYLADRLADMK